MASHTLERAITEERGLLRSTSFELEDVEASERSHKRITRPSEDRLDARRAWGKVSAWSRIRSTCIGLTAALAIISVILLLVILGYDEAVYRAQRHKINKAIASKINEEQMAKNLRPAEGTSKVPTIVQPHRFGKPQGFKVIALIFYGRAPVVAILDCYLKKNLVSNGGFLDEVHWAVNTENLEDLEYLDELVKTADTYKKIVIPEFGYNSIWEHAVEPGHMYIKIDDDIVRPLRTIYLLPLRFNHK